MTEEIKEILSIVSEGQDSIQRQQLVNYITNLQKENEIQKKDNESLKKFYNDLVNKYENLIEKYQDYKQRNEKAVEYIENHTENIDRGTYYEDYVETYDLLNILKGGDE